MTLDDAIDNVIRKEGGYSNLPADRGGETNMGITIAVARQQGYIGQMRDMPRSFAVEVYRRKYVIAPGFDKVALLSPAIAAELVDTGANMGPRNATGFLQRLLNVLNRQQVDYKDIGVDGKVGPATLGALKAYLDKRSTEGGCRLLKALNALQGNRYVELAEHDATQETFMYGWLDRLD